MKHIQELSIAIILTGLVFTGSSAKAGVTSPSFILDYYQMQDNAILHYHRGEAWLDVEDYDAAAREFQIAIKLRPSSTLTAAIYNDLGLVYDHVHELSRASQAFEQAMAHNPNFSAYYENLVMTYQQRGQVNGQIKHLEKRIKSDPQTLQNWYLLGLLYRAAGNPVAARHAFETYVHLAPDIVLADAAKRYLHTTDAGQKGVASPTIKNTGLK